jgi:hypothetical protein
MVHVPSFFLITDQRTQEACKLPSIGPDSFLPSLPGENTTLNPTCTMNAGRPNIAKFFYHDISSPEPRNCAGVSL